MVRLLSATSADHPGGVIRQWLSSARSCQSWTHRDRPELTFQCCSFITSLRRRYAAISVDTSRWRRTRQPGLVHQVSVIHPRSLLGNLLTCVRRSRRQPDILVGDVPPINLQQIQDAGGRAQVQAFLDAAGASLRNVHKIEPVLRIPTALGLAQLLSLVPLPERMRHCRWIARCAAEDDKRVAVVIVVLAARWPPRPRWRGTGRLTPPGSFAAIPDYWHQTATIDRTQQHRKPHPGSRPGRAGRTVRNPGVGQRSRRASSGAGRQSLGPGFHSADPVAGHSRRWTRCSGYWPPYACRPGWLTPRRGNHFLLVVRNGAWIGTSPARPDPGAPGRRRFTGLTKGRPVPTGRACTRRGSSRQRSAPDVSGGGRSTTARGPVRCGRGSPRRPYTDANRLTASTAAGSACALASGACQPPVAPLAWRC